MYIKLHYAARLHQPEQADTLALEVEDICRSNGWPCQIWEKDWSKPASLSGGLDDGVIRVEGHAPLRGITFKPHPECETVWLTFTPDGTLHSLFSLMDPEWTVVGGARPWNRVKTGFDGTKTHVMLCNLFRFLHGKYFEELLISDASDFWEHRDEERFEAWMAKIQQEEASLEEEIQALESATDLSEEQRTEALYTLIRQFGERNRPDKEQER